MVFRIGPLCLHVPPASPLASNLPLRVKWRTRYPTLLPSQVPLHPRGTRCANCRCGGTSHTSPRASLYRLR